MASVRLASHQPADRWVDPAFIAGALGAVVIGVVVVLLLAGRVGWSRLHRVELGASAALATLPAAALWSRAVEPAVITPVGAVVLMAPLAVAVAHRSFRFDHRARVAWVAAVVVGAGQLGWMTFGTGRWDNGNDWVASVVVYVALAWASVAGLWTLSWFVGWGRSGTRPVLRLGRGESGEAPLVDLAHDHDGGLAHEPAPRAHAHETRVHARRVRLLAYVLLAVGVAMIPTFVFAVPGIVALVVSLLLLRATQVPTRTAGPWPHWSPAVLFGAAAAAIVVTILVVAWVTRDELEAGWSSALAVGVMTWTAAFAGAVASARHEVFRDR